jgi:tetratricopeptide (TPR) repeat protein
MSDAQPFADATLLFDPRDCGRAQKLRKHLRRFSLSKAAAGELGLPRRPLRRVALRPLDASTDIAGSPHPIVVCSPHLVRHEPLFQRLDTAHVRSLCPVIIKGDPDAEDGQACFPPTLRHLLQSADLLAIDLRKHGDGWTDGVAKIISRTTETPLGALRDREGENERKRVRRLAVLSGGLVATLIAAAMLSWQAAIAGQAMTASLAGVAGFLHESGRDMLAYARVPGATSLEAVAALTRNQEESDRVAAAFESNGVFAGAAPLVRGYSYVYLAEALRARGEFDAAIAEMEQAVAIIMDDHLDATAMGLGSNLQWRQNVLQLLSQTYQNAGDVQGVERASAMIVGVAQDELARRPHDDVARAIYIQAIAEPILATPPTATTREAAEARMASIRKALQDTPSGSLAGTQFLSAMCVSFTLSTPASYEELGLAIETTVQLVLFDKAVASHDRAWADAQFAAARIAVERLEAVAGERAKPARDQLRLRGRTLAIADGRLEEVEAFLLRSLDARRQTAAAEPHIMINRTIVPSVLASLAHVRVLRHDPRFVMDLDEALAIRRRLLADDSTNLMLKAELGAALTGTANELAAAGHCARARAVRAEGAALLTTVVNAQSRVPAWRQALQTGSQGRPCRPGQWMTTP